MMRQMSGCECHPRTIHADHHRLPHTEYVAWLGNVKNFVEA